jgi:type II secretory pathway pseudopilin PulG
VWFKILVALTSVIAAILGGLQTFLRSSDRAAVHRAAATRYASLRRTIELAIARSATAPIDDSALDKLEERLSELADQSPAIPRRVWKRTERMLARRSKP